jgi:hypothetical protein
LAIREEISCYFWRINAVKYIQEVVHAIVFDKCSVLKVKLPLIGLKDIIVVYLIGINVADLWLLLEGCQLILELTDFITQRFLLLQLLSNLV